MTFRPTKLLLLIGRVVALSLTVAVFLVVASIGVLATTQVKVPDTVRSIVVEHVRNALGGGDGIEFGNVAFSVDPRRVQPEIRLEDVRLRGVLPSWSVHLEEIDVGVDLRSALNGEFSPRDVAVRGVSMLRVAAPSETQAPADSAAGPAPETLLADLSSALGFVDRMNLGRITVSNARVIDEVHERALGLSGGWLSMTGTGASRQYVGGFALTSGGSSVGTVRIDGNFESQSGVSEINAVLSGFEVSGTLDLLADFEAVPRVELPVDATVELRFGRDGTLERSRGSVALGPGTFKLPAGSGEVSLNSASAEIDFDSGSGRFDFSEVAIDFAGAVAEAEGHATYIGAGGSGGRVEGQFNQLALTPSDANPFELPEPGTTLSGAFRLDFDPYVLRFSHSRVAVGDAVVFAEGEVGIGGGEWFGKAEIEADAMTHESLISLWPKGLASGPRNWLAKNVSGATLRSIGGVIARATDGDWTTRLNFQFDGATLTYLPTLPPATEVAGYAELTDRNAAFGFERGYVEVPESGRVDLSGSDLIIPNIWNGRIPSRIRLRIAGDVDPVLSLLNYPPYLLLDKGGIGSNVLDAHATGTANIELPLLKTVRMADVSFTVEGGLADVVASGPAGRVVIEADLLNVSADREGIVVSGVGTVNGVAGSGEWRRRFDQGEGRADLVVGRINLTQKLLDEFGISVPEGILRNSVGADYYVSVVKGSPPSFGITANVTELGFNLPLPHLRSGQAESPKILLEGRLSRPPEITRISVDGTGISAEGRYVTGSDGRQGRIEFSNLRIGEWFDAALHINTESDAEFRFELAGGVIDLSRLPGSEFGLEGLPSLNQPVSVRLDSLIFNSRVTLTDLVGEITLAGNVGGRFTGKINGGQLVGIEVAPTANGLGAYLVTDDAGSAMRDGGVVTGLYGGQFELALLPKQESGAYSGQLRMTSATIRDMPTLSEILSYVSIVGLVDQLVSQGISFTEVEARFELDRDMLVLNNGTAIGPSIGIKMSGTWDSENSIADLEGVITPFNPVNEIARLTPLQLIGLEKGSGLGAIEFSVSGPTDDLTATANPLSAITPGFFKELFDF